MKLDKDRDSFIRLIPLYIPFKNNITEESKQPIYSGVSQLSKPRDPKGKFCKETV
jgi:hypothetical protein